MVADILENRDIELKPIDAIKHIRHKLGFQLQSLHVLKNTE